MKPQNIVLRVFWWAEIILAARILLFFLPITIKHLFAHSSSMNFAIDFFVLLVTFGALLFLVAGIASVLGSRLWRFWHYWAAALIFLLTSNLYHLIKTTGAELSLYYFYPVLFSSLIGIALAILKPQLQD